MFYNSHTTMLNKFFSLLGLSANAESDALIISLTVICILLVIGVVVFHQTEGLNRFDSLYFAVASISTIGYGDIVPTSVASKIIIMVYAFTGVPLFIFTGGLLLERRIRDVVGGYIHDQEEHLEEITEELEGIEEDIEKVEKELKKHKKETKLNKNNKKKKTRRKRLVG